MFQVPDECSDKKAERPTLQDLKLNFVHSSLEASQKLLDPLINFQSYNFCFSNKVNALLGTNCKC